MTAVRTDVINTALIELGQPTSVGPDTDTRQTVVSIRNLYERRARFMLGNYPWNFARKVERLTSPSGTAVGWDYQFNRPAGCLRIIRITNRERQDRAPDIPFEEREGVIYTNHAETWLAYVDGVYASNESGGWPEPAKHALGLDLANLVAPGLDLSAVRRDELRKDAKRALKDAQLWDAQQNKVERPPLSAWQRNHISGRHGENG